MSRPKVHCTGVYSNAFDMHFELDGATIPRPTAYAPQVPSPQSCRLGFFSTYSQGFSRVIDEVRTLAHRPISPSPIAPRWCTDWCAASSLTIFERGDELAAEVRDIRNDAAPDRVGSGLETSAYVSDGPLRRSQKCRF